MENDDLAAYLDALSRDRCYRVERVLKSAAHETTEVVYFTGNAGGELGPFVRKRINEDAGLGQAYQELLDAQRRGRRFRHLPFIHEVYRCDGELVVVMEYVAGRTLHDEVYEHDASPALAARLFPLLCDGVMELHEEFLAPLIHRDLKPSNVIVNGDGLTIIDFGIARTYRADGRTDTTHFGTRAYAPPEQFGYGQTDVRSDVYALGMILYYLLTEENPDSETVAQGFPALEPWPALRQVAVRACAFDPAARFQSVRALKRAFLEATVVPEGDSGAGRFEGEPGAGCDTPDAGKSQAYPGGQLCDSSAAALPHPSLSGPAVDAFQPPLQSSASDAFRPSGSGPRPSGVRPSEVAGLIWDGVVFLLWFLLMTATIHAVVVPSPEMSHDPLWFLILVYPVSMGTLFTGIAYGLLDKRVLRRKIPLLRSQTFPRGLLVALILAVSSLGALVLLAIISTIFFPAA